MAKGKSGSPGQTDTEFQQQETYDVAVIGAGPAGSIAAERIAKAGWRVVLLEKSEYPGKDSVCGGMIGYKDVDLFQIDTSLIEKRFANSIGYLPWGSIETHYKGTVWQVILTAQRKNLDRFLAERAARSGADLRTKCRVTHVERISTGRVTLKLSGTKKEITSKLVVFADGPVTLAHRCFGIGFEAKPDQTAVSVICDFEYPDNPMDYYESYYVREAVPPSFGWSFPFSEHLNFGLLIPRYEMEKNPRLFNDVLDFMLQRYEPTLRLIKGRRRIRKRGAFLPMRPAKRIHDDSCLVVGDAAGFVSALTGVGITFAMHSGAAAAETAIEALQRNDFSAKFLARYPRRWRASQKGKKLLIMDVIHRTLRPLHRIDPQFLVKVLFFLQLTVTKAEGPSPTLLEILRILFFPLLGNPEIKIVRCGKAAKGSPAKVFGKGA